MNTVKKGGKNRSGSQDEEGGGEVNEIEEVELGSQVRWGGQGEGWELGRNQTSGAKVGVWPWEWVTEVGWKRNHW